MENRLVRAVDIFGRGNVGTGLVGGVELVTMKAAGLTQIDLGIESGSPKSLLRLNKKITIEQIKEKVALAKRHVRVFGFFMIGIPGEEEDDVRQTFELAKQLDLDRWSWSIYSPLPGSPLYDELIDEGRIQPFALDHARVHFTEAYDGICAIPPDRLKALRRDQRPLHASTTGGLRWGLPSGQVGSGDLRTMSRPSAHGTK